MGSLSSQLLVVTRQNVTTSQEKKAMNSTWKSSFGRSRTPMGTVPISVIYGHKYPLSPIPAPKAGPSTPPSHRSSSVWPSSLAREPPQLVQRRKYENGVTVTNGTNGLDTADTAQKKTRGCLSYISSLRNRQTTTTTATTTVTREPA